jgi:hypothetical protein
MTRSLSPPFRIASVGSVDCAWRVELNGEWRDLPEVMERWDYATDLTLSVQLSADSRDIRQSCGLPAGDTLKTAVLWHATGTNLRGACCVGRTLGDGLATFTLEGACLGGTLNLEAQILVDPGPDQRDALTPSRRGSVVWRARTATVLEGDAPRFPIEPVDFGTWTPGSARAAWHLMWNPGDLMAAAMGSVRLYVNRTHPLMARVMVDPTGKPDAGLALGAMRYDLVRAILSGCLGNPDFVEEAAFPAGSVGDIGMGIARIHFPNETITTLRSLYIEDPQRFETRVQDAVRLWAPES